MQMNALHMRFAAIAAAIVLFSIVSLCGGMRERSAGYIHIDFSMDPELFQGLEVEIDGEKVGKLEPTGRTTRTGFGVTRGTHEVRVLHPAIGCRVATVELEHPGQQAGLMLNIGDLGDGTEFFFDY